MTTPEQSPPPKRAAKFGGVEEQFNTIGGSKKPVPEPQEISPMDVKVKTSKNQEVKTSDKKEEKGQQTIRLPLSLRKWLRMQAPIEERDLSDIVTDALLDYKKKIGQ